MQLNALVLSITCWLNLLRLILTVSKAGAHPPDHDGYGLCEHFRRQNISHKIHPTGSLALEKCAAWNEKASLLMETTTYNLIDINIITRLYGLRPLHSHCQLCGSCSHCSSRTETPLRIPTVVQSYAACFPSPMYPLPRRVLEFLFDHRRVGMAWTETLDANVTTSVIVNQAPFLCQISGKLYDELENEQYMPLLAMSPFMLVTSTMGLGHFVSSICLASIFSLVPKVVAQIHQSLRHCPLPITPTPAKSRYEVTTRLLRGTAYYQDPRYRPHSLEDWMCIHRLRISPHGGLLRINEAGLLPRGSHIPVEPAAQDSRR